MLNNSVSGDPLPEPAIVAPRAGAPALIALGLANPAAQGLGRAADLGGNRADRGRLRGVLALVIEHHPDRTGADLRRIRGHMLGHGSILPGSGASGKPGAVHCLLTCEVCGLAMYGVTRPATATKPERQYYECRGKDCVLSARTAACPSRHVKAEEIEPVVWNHVAGPRRTRGIEQATGKSGSSRSTR